MADVVVTKPGVLFKKGNIEQLRNLITNNRGTDGTFYLAENEQNLYFGTSTGEIKRIQGTVVSYATLTDFNNDVTPPYSTDLIYFIANKDALVRWNGTKWIQLNATAESVNKAIEDITTAIGTLEDGVAANAAAIEQNQKDIAQNKADIATKAANSDLTALAGRVTVNEGAIAANAAAVATKAEQASLDATNDAVSENAKDIKDLQELADTLATQEALNDLDERVAAAESTIKDHTEQIATKASIESVESLEDRMDAAEEGIENNATNIQNNLNTFNEYKTANNKRVTDVEGRVTAAEGKITDLTNNKADKGTVSELSTKVDQNADAIKQNASDISTNKADIKKNADAIALKANNADLENAVGRVGSLETRMGTAETNITNLTRDKADQSSLDAANDAIADHETRLGNLVKKDTELQQSITNLADTKADKTAVNQTTSGLNTRLTQAEKDIDNLQAADNQMGDAIAALDQNKVTKEAGKGLIDTNEIKRLSEMESGANRTFVDFEFDVNQDDDHHTLNTGVVSQRFADIESDISEMDEQLSEQIQSLSDTKADKTAMEAADKELRDAITSINESIGSGSGNTTLTGRISALETLTGEHSGTLSGHGERLDSIESTITNTLATKQELADAKEELTEDINSQIDAANAMKYRGSITSIDDLPTAGHTFSDNTKLSIGDTYVVAEAFGAYNAGDLLVARGTEADGVLTGTVSWDHVRTGYSTAFDQTLEVEDDNNAAVVKLKTYTGADGTSIGFASANEGLTIEASGNVITFNMVWGSFDS